jgi:hypothetical protein
MGFYACDRPHPSHLPLSVTLLIRDKETLDGECMHSGNTEARSDLCITGISQMVTLFNPPWSHCLLLLTHDVAYFKSKANRPEVVLECCF